MREVVRIRELTLGPDHKYTQQAQVRLRGLELAVTDHPD